MGKNYVCQMSKTVVPSSGVAEHHQIRFGWGIHDPCQDPAQSSHIEFLRGIRDCVPEGGVPSAIRFGQFPGNILPLGRHTTTDLVPKVRLLLGSSWKVHIECWIRVIALPSRASGRYDAAFTYLEIRRSASVK